jgi:hypothetical protein
MKGITYFYAIDTINFNTLVALVDYRTYDEKMLYEALKNDSTLMHLGTADDSLYQHFYDSIRYSSTGLYDEVKDSMLNGSIADAKALNDAVVNQDAMDNNRHLLNKIYLSTFAEGIYYFDSLQEQSLTELAYLDPGVDGDAVYSARAMLRIEPDVVETRNMESNSSIIQASKPVSFDYNLFPNPNNGTMTLEYNLNENEEGLLTIYSLIGELINTYPIRNNSKSILINESGLANGMYFYQIVINNQKAASGKLIINK